MNSDKMLQKLLQSAAQVEPLADAPSESLPFPLEARIMAGFRRNGAAGEPFAFFPLFRAALACAAAVALLCAGFHYQQVQQADEFVLPLNYAVNTAVQ